MSVFFLWVYVCGCVCVCAFVCVGERCPVQEVKRVVDLGGDKDGKGCKPNGLCFSGDGKTLYFTDTMYRNMTDDLGRNEWVQ